MPRFEVYVPASPPQLPVAITLRVESENWLAALKVGLQKVGGGELAANILCDIQGDGSIHVTDPGGARVFRIREVTEAAAPAPAPTMDLNRTAVMHAPPAAAPPAAATAPAPAAARPSPAPAARAAAPAPRPAAAPQAPVARPPAPAPRAPQRAAPAPRVTPDSVASLVEEVAGPGEPVSNPIGRIREEPTSDALADVFFRASELNEKTSRDEGLRFVLDLAMEKVGCDAGSVLLGRFQSGDLVFVAVRGPKADEILRLRLTVPFGKGIVGFSAQENVCLAVSDAQKDPRFYRAVSEAVGYATRSALCAPIAAGGRVHGALELLNKGSGAFTASDLALLSYLGAKAGEFLERLT